MGTKLNLPILNECLLHGTIEQRRLFAEQLIDASYQFGCFYLKQHSVSTALCNQVIAKAREFFLLPAEDKSKIHIRHSSHFRGYSEMKNERDWREQGHFGLEKLAAYQPLNDREYHRLQGPNLWLTQLGQDWQCTMLSFLESVDSLSQNILSVLAKMLGLSEDYFTALADEPPYLLMKLIYYHPQVTNQLKHIGVAPHCDWSWITFLLQDEIGGLQVKLPNNNWVDVTPIPNTFVVNIGELLEILTGGYLKATPHRVINQSSTHSRISVPIFINPALTARITSIPLSQKYYNAPQNTFSFDDEHVHRVSDPCNLIQSFVFGDSEWKRKGQNCWCYKKACHDSKFG